MAGKADWNATSSKWLRHPGLGSEGVEYYAEDWVLTLAAVWLPLMANVVAVTGNLLLLHNLSTTRSLVTISNSYIFQLSFADLLCQLLGLLYFIYNTIGFKFNIFLCNLVGFSMLICTGVSPLYLYLYGIDWYLKVCPEERRCVHFRSQFQGRTIWRAWSLVWILIMINVAINSKTYGGANLCNEFSYFFPPYEMVNATFVFFVFTSLTESMVKIVLTVGWSGTPRVLFWMMLVFTVCQVPHCLVKTFLSLVVKVPGIVETFTSMLLYLNPCLNIMVYMKFYPELLSTANI